MRRYTRAPHLLSAVKIRVNEAIRDARAAVQELDRHIRWLMWHREERRR